MRKQHVCNTAGVAMFIGNIDCFPSGRPICLYICHFIIYKINFQLPANYDFSYDVQDNGVSLDFGHNEKRKDDLATGSYHVLLPDGRMQLVEYEAGPDGYKPQVGPISSSPFCCKHVVFAAHRFESSLNVRGSLTRSTRNTSNPPIVCTRGHDRCLKVLSYPQLT